MKYDPDTESFPGARFLAGDAKKFHTMMNLFIGTEPGLENYVKDDGEVLIALGTSLFLPRLSAIGYYTGRLDRLTSWLLQSHRPVLTGDERGRQSFLTLRIAVDSTMLQFPVGAARLTLPREQMNARSKLAAWLVSKGQDPRDYDIEPVQEKIL